MENYINPLPEELIHNIYCYLNCDYINDVVNIFKLNINYETIFRLKYTDLYPHIKKVMIMESLNIDWIHILRYFENIDYDIVLKQHKLNLEDPNESYDLDIPVPKAEEPSPMIYKLIFSAFILRDTPNCFKFVKKLDNIYNYKYNGDSIYNTIHDYALKRETGIISFFKTGKLDRIYSSTDIKNINIGVDHQLREIDRAYLTLMLFDDPNFDKSDLNVLINDLSYLEPPTNMIYNQNYEIEHALLTFFRNSN